MWILHETHNTPHRVEQLVILNKVEGLLGRGDGSFFFQEKYKFIRSIDPSQQNISTALLFGGVKWWNSGVILIFSGLAADRAQ